MSRPPRERKVRPPSDCTPGGGEGPSVGVIIAGIAGLAGAIGLGYLLGSTSRDDAEEEKETQREVDAHRSRLQQQQQRQQQQQQQQQQQVNHSYYPAHFSSSSSSISSASRHTEVKEATDHSLAATKAYEDEAARRAQRGEGVPLSLSSSSSSSSSSSPSVSISAPIPAPPPASAPPAHDAAHLAQQLEDATVCKICYTEGMDCVLFPCRHQCCCFACSRQLQECPLCRTNITSVERVFRA